MRPSSSLGLYLLSGLAVFWLANCAALKLAPLQVKSAMAIDSTVFAVSAASGGRGPTPQIFHDYQSGTGWNFTAPSPVWLEVPGLRTDKGIPSRILVRKADRKIRLTFYETAWSPGSLKEDSIFPALAYLFKADPVSSLPSLAPLSSGMVIFKPPQDTLRHWGLLVRSDTALLFIHIESKHPLELGQIGTLPDLEKDYRPRKPGDASDSSQRSFKEMLENTWGLKSLEDANWQAALRHFQAALALDSTHAAYLVNPVTEIVLAFRAGNRIYFCGNGGSAADARSCRSPPASGRTRRPTARRPG